MIDVGYDVVDVFDPDGKTDQLGGNPAGLLLFLVKLGMGRGGRVNGQALGIPDVGEVGEKLKVVDELGSRLGPALDSENDHGASLAIEVLLVEGMHRVVLQTGETHPLDGVVGLEVLGHGEGILAMTLHAEGKSLDSLQELPGVIGRKTGPEVAQGNGTHAQDEGQGARGSGRS